VAIFQHLSCYKVSDNFAYALLLPAKHIDHTPDQLLVRTYEISEFINQYSPGHLRSATRRLAPLFEHELKPETVETYIFSY